jgi:hypothetical protein
MSGHDPQRPGMAGTTRSDARKRFGYSTAGTCDGFCRGGESEPDIPVKHCSTWVWIALNGIQPYAAGANGEDNSAGI